MVVQAQKEIMTCKLCEICDKLANLGVETNRFSKGDRDNHVKNYAYDQPTNHLNPTI